MTNLITKSTARQFTAALSNAGIKHDSVETRKIPAYEPIPAGTNYELGCRFHNLLLRIRDRSAMSPEEKELLPWLNEVRQALRDQGVAFFEPEVSLSSDCGLPGGRCDLLLHCDQRAPSSVGVAEIKICDSLPEDARPADLLQVAGYSAHAANAFSGLSPWTVVVYVSFRSRRIRLFTHQSSKGLRRAALALLAA